MRGKLESPLAAWVKCMEQVSRGVFQERNKDCGEDLKKTSLSLLSEWAPSPIPIPHSLMLTSHSRKEI